MKKAYKIYLAAPWITRHAMPTAATALEQEGHTITHKWWEWEDSPESNTAYMTKCALSDVKGVLDADVVIVFNTAKSEGKAVEQGIAIAEEKPIIAVGERGAVSKNVFHYLNNYHWVSSLEEAITKLQEIEFDYKRHV